MSLTPKSESQLPRVNLHPERSKPWPPLPSEPMPAGPPPGPRRKSSAPPALLVALFALGALGAYVVYRALHRSENSTVQRPARGC